jgi:GT2 family glycosyltransferase
MRAPPESTVEIRDIPAGWALVDARVRSHGRYYASILRAYRRGGGVEEFPLSVQPNGRIHELVRLPRDVAGLAWVPPENWRLEPPQIALRKIGWFERTWRMALRVARTWLRLSREERAECGLTVARALFDLPACYRISTGFRVRFWEPPYPEWIEHFDTLAEKDLVRIDAHMKRFAARPRFRVVVAGDGAGPEAVGATLASLRAQIYRNFDCTLLDDAADIAPQDAAPSADDAAITRVAGTAVEDWLGNFNAELSRAGRDQWVMLLRAGDSLARHALYWLAWEAQARPRASVIYWDDDACDRQGRRSAPRFKPDWSPAHFYSTHYIGAAAIMAGDAVSESGGVRPGCCRHGNYDLLLRMMDPARESFTHVPAVLLHRDLTSGRNAWEDPQWCAEALREHLRRNHIDAEVLSMLPGCRRVRYRMPEAAPLVSIIVPTRDAVRLLRGCVESLLEKTAYPNYEILVIDNRSADPEALSYLAEIAGRERVRVVRYDRRFNYSAINNFAARRARGDALCLLNNDTEVISPDWLDEMVGHLLQPRVGAVGAKLYYPDGRVQHAGVTVGPGGCANHLHLEIEGAEPGYCGRAGIAHELSAVTGACLLTWKRVYEELAGLNESRLTIAFNDVDYCLRLQEVGYRVIYTPHAELYHHESATRGIDMGLQKRLRARREIRYMRRRWRTRMQHDPYYNPNLSYRRSDFSLTETQRVKKPWLDAGLTKA